MTRRTVMNPRATPVHTPGIGALFVLAIWTALLLFAPPHSNAFWALNGFRSVTWGARALLLCAALAALLAARAWTSARAWAWTAVVLIPVVAFVARDRGHVLGDTWMRYQTIALLGRELDQLVFSRLTSSLHANVLDAVVNCVFPGWLQTQGWSLDDAISATSALVGIVFMAGVWRLSKRLAPAPEARYAIALGLTLTGGLETFAGYAESTGLFLALGTWWWAELLSPLDRRSRAVRTLLAWWLMLAAHRLALLGLLVHVARVTEPPMPGEDRAARRDLAIGTAISAAGAVLLLSFAGGSHQILSDALEMLRTVTGGRAPLSDIVNALMLVSPLAFLALLIVRRGLRPDSGATPAVLVAGVVAYLPIALLAPAAPSGLGYHRDWDLLSFAGFVVSLMGAWLLSCLQADRVRVAVAACAPLLALQAGSWLAVNADASASLLRARTLAFGRPLIPADQRSHVLVLLAQREMASGNPRQSARDYEASFGLVANGNNELRAAEAWLAAGERDSARIALQRGRSAGPLSPIQEAKATALERQVAATDSVSTTAAP